MALVDEARAEERREAEEHRRMEEQELRHGLEIGRIGGVPRHGGERKAEKAGERAEDDEGTNHGTCLAVPGPHP